VKEKLLQKLGKLVTYLRSQYRVILAIALILVAIAIVYGNDLAILANEALQNEAFSHVLLLPFFAGFLFYLKRDAVKASLALDKIRRRTGTRYLNELLGVVLCLIAFLIYWYGSYTFYPLEYHVLSLPIFIMGIVLIFLNIKALKVLFFPILFLVFLVPPPSQILYTLGGFLANFNTQIAYSVMRFFGLPVTLSYSYGPPALMLVNTAGTPLSFSVDIPCSGVYSLIAFTMFAAFLAFLALTSFAKKIVLFVVGFLVFGFLNIIRLISIVSVGYWFGEEMALLMFHAVAGLLLIFIGMLIILAFSEKILKIRMLTKLPMQQPCPACAPSSKISDFFCSKCGRFVDKLKLTNSKTLFLKLFLLILGCSIVVLTIHAPTFATAEGPLALFSNNSEQNAANVFPEIPGYRLSYLYRDTDYEKIARQDISVVYVYFPLNRSSSTVYVDVGVANTISNLHSWEVCFITWQTAQGQYPLVTVFDDREVQLLQDTPLTARYLVFDSPKGYTQVTLYWYEKATFKTELTVEQKYVRISLIIMTANQTAYPQFEDELLPIGQAIAAEWEPMKTQALISLGVPAQQALLAVSVAFLAVTVTTQYFSEKRRASNNLKLFNNFASPEEKLVLQSVHESVAEKKHVQTSDILENVRKKEGGRSMNFEKVLNTLNVLDEYGLVRRAVVSVENVPLLVWKV